MQRSFEKIDVESICQTLKEIADNYPASSKEYKALELAAQAVIHVEMSQTMQAFRAFVRDSNKGISAKQKRVLKKMGIL